MFGDKIKLRMLHKTYNKHENIEEDGFCPICWDGVDNTFELMQKFPFEDIFYSGVVWDWDIVKVMLMAWGPNGTKEKLGEIPYILFKNWKEYLMFINQFPEFIDKTYLLKLNECSITDQYKNMRYSKIPFKNILFIYSDQMDYEKMKEMVDGIDENIVINFNDKLSPHHENQFLSKPNLFYNAQVSANKYVKLLEKNPLSFAYLAFKSYGLKYCKELITPEAKELAIQLIKRVYHINNKDGEYGDLLNFLAQEEKRKIVEDNIIEQYVQAIMEEDILQIMKLESKLFNFKIKIKIRGESVFFEDYKDKQKCIYYKKRLQSTNIYIEYNTTNFDINI